MREGSLFEVLFVSWVELLFVSWVWSWVVSGGGSFGSQSELSVLSTISSRVALVNVSVPLEDNPPALGVQYFTVLHCSVTVMLPM
jgi:hypothetical protein